MMGDIEVMQAALNAHSMFKEVLLCAKGAKGREKLVVPSI